MDGHGSLSVSMDDFPSAELGDKKDAGFVDAGLQVEFLNYFWVMNLR